MVNLSINYYRIEDQFQALSNDIKLIVLHPVAYSDHRMFGQILLKLTDAIYIHLPTAFDSPQDLIESVVVAIQEQSGQTSDAKLDDTKALAAQLATAVNKSSASLLYIDGYDGESAEILHELLIHMSTQLDKGCRIAVSGRELPTPFLSARETAGKVAILPTDTKRMLVDYVHPEEGKDFLEVRAFGQGQVLVNGVSINRWEGFLPRALFHFFVDRAMTTRDDIFRTFWSKLATREATNVFHVTKRKISEILGINLTVYSAGFYRVSPDVDLYYDVVNFQEAVQNAAVVDDDEAEELYQIAIDLYREDFLTSIDSHWVVRRRDEMRLTYTDALIGLARIHERKGNLDHALGLFLRASGVAPNREDLSRSIMHIYHELGQADRAIELFQNLQKRLKKSLGVTPDPQTVELVERIRAEAP